MKIGKWAIAAIVVFGFIVASCGDKGGGDSTVAATGIALSGNTLSGDNKLTMVVGATETLTAILTPSNATSKVTWTTTNATWVDIGPNKKDGKVTAASVTLEAKTIPPNNATVTITATTDNGKTITCAVTVTANVSVQTITLDKSMLEMEEEDVANLTVTISPSSASNKAVTWSSSDEDLVTVTATSATGATVTAVAEGTAIITVTSLADNTKKATCEVTVTPFDPGAIRPTGITMGKGATTLEVGQTETLSYTIEPPDATLTNVNWASSDPTKASVVNGLVTALAVGETTITVTTQSGNHQSFCVVTVTASTTDPTKVATVTLNKSVTTLQVGATETLTATVLPTTAINRSITWSSSNSNIATVSTGGLVTAVVPGQVSITATSNDDNTKYDSCLVTVPGTNVESVGLNKPEIELLIGYYETLIATVLPADATVKTVTWTSSDEDIAELLNAQTTIGTLTLPAGTVIGWEEGEATIKVTTKDGGHIAECVVTVKPVSVTGVTLYPPSLTLSVGGSPGLITPTVLPANATNTDVTWSVTASDPAGVVSVDEFEYIDWYWVPGSIGRVTPRAVGTATITGTTNDGSHVATCTVTVTAAKKKVNRMVWIEPGKFKMGLPSDQAGYTSELPQHEVTLNGFYMSEIAVSQGWYKQVTDFNPSYFEIEDDSEYFWNWPVDGITWYDAIEFCIKLNQQNSSNGIEQVYSMTNRTPATGYPITNATVTADYTKNGYRLPTEAEWEYACRAGTTSPFNTGFDFLDQYEDANFDDGSDDAWWMTIPGGPDPEYPEWPWIVYPPNNWGLYDMHGNVEEWCWDWFQANYNGAGNNNPTGPVSPPQLGNPPASYKVARGGAFLDEEFDVRSASRNGWQPGQKHSNPIFEYGLPWMSFRVVLPEAGGNIVGTSAPLPRKAMSSVPGNTQRIARSAMALKQYKSIKSLDAKRLMSFGYAPLNIKGHGVKAKPGSASFSPAMLFNLPGKIEATSPVKPQALRRKSVLE
jgi:uncharacterized protein YjdB